MIALLLATLITPQDPTPPAPGWRDVDGVVFVINEDIVTQRGFQRQLQEYLGTHQGVDPQRARDMLVAELVRGSLGAQAGEAMGVDAALVKRSVRDYERRVIDSKGGVAQYSAILTARGTTAEEMRAEYEKAVLRDMWESSRTGQGPNQQQKIIADRYVRPGVLRITYTEFSRNPSLVTRLGGESSKVVLQVLELDPAKVGGTAQLEASAAAVRARIASGASDFETEYNNFGLASGTWRPTEPLDEASMARDYPDLARFVAAAKAGDLLPVIPPKGNLKTWRIVRLVERVPAHVPAFRSADLQRSIRDLLQSVLDTRRLDAARKQQYDSSYIWPSGAEGH